MRDGRDGRDERREIWERALSRHRGPKGGRKSEYKQKRFQNGPTCRMNVVG